MQNSLTPWNLKAGESISRLKFVRRQRILKSRCHGSQKLRKQSQLTNRVHRNQFLGRTDFPDCEMLDVMIASALKKILNSHIQFLKRICVEEQRAQKYDRFLRGRQISYMNCELFHAPRAYESVQGLSDLFTFRLQNDDVQDFRCQMVSGTIISR